MRFFSRRNKNQQATAIAELPAKNIHQTAKEIRMQKIKEYEIKMAAASKSVVTTEVMKNDLLLSVNAEPNQKIVTSRAQPVIVDDATDNEDPSTNEDDDEDDEQQQRQSEQSQQVPPISSPLSVLSMDTKPILIHPPRSLTRDNENDATTDHNSETTSNNNDKSPLGLLCGCI